MLVALVVAGVVGAVLLVAGGSDSRSPETTVRDFITAGKAQDCEAGLDLVTEDSWPVLFSSWDGSGDAPEMTRSEAVEGCEDQSEDDTSDPDVKSVEVTSEDGDSATVKVTVEEDGETDSEELPLVKVSGDWKIDFRSYFEEQLSELPDLEG